ncbi:sigma-70 family RNA polymerase sigma factor [Candidatus Uhrbacteria bacterium]|nr:sigma-70 family RNA polymerase sigma factor [Candidatus Uhrbacteria bacterium]
MELSEEKKLVKLAQKDPEAFGGIFDAYHNAIYGYIVRRVGNIHDSQDITANTFFRALTRLWQFQWRNISIANWLYRIAGNEINQFYRRKKNPPLSLDALMDDEQYDPPSQENILEEMIEQERTLARSAEWRRIRALITQLSAPYQEVLALRFFEGKKISEIANIMGRKEGTIKSLLSRSIKVLRTYRNQSSKTALYQQEDADRPELLASK